MHRPPHLAARVDVPILECHDPLAVLDRERRVEKGIHEREEGRADGDADRQAQTTDQRQRGVLGQHARPELEVHPRVVQPAESARVALVLLGLLDAAEGAPRSQPRFIPGHAFGDELVFEQLKV
ncbi:MAG TPA: hypothetical protein VM364_15915 [Vicinamibacterales bacterium]|nr:hypothetical protein [Vicinamibacterales bacterium]